MVRENVTITNVSMDELIAQFREVIKDEVCAAANKQEPVKAEVDLITIKEVMSILNVSRVTVDSFSRRGLLKAYRLGTRVRYKRHEVYECLQQIHVK